eukprot:9142814-Karenia_brevis.AAC.1
MVQRARVSYHGNQWVEHCEPPAPITRISGSGTAALQRYNARGFPITGISGLGTAVLQRYNARGFPITGI